jgi:hypothetical protein
MTNEDPAIPIKKRSVMRPAAVLTSPVRAQGMDATQRMAAMGSLAPYLSQSGPMSILMTMVVASLAMEEDHTCFLVRLKSFWISPSKGATANHTIKARKNDIQAQ